MVAGSIEFWQQPQVIVPLLAAKRQSRRLAAGRAGFLILQSALVQEPVRLLCFPTLEPA